MPLPSFLRNWAEALHPVTPGIKPGPAAIADCRGQIVCGAFLMPGFAIGGVTVGLMEGLSCRSGSIEMIWLQALALVNVDEGAQSDPGQFSKPRRARAAALAVRRQSRLLKAVRAYRTIAEAIKELIGNDGCRLHRNRGQKVRKTTRSCRSFAASVHLLPPNRPCPGTNQHTGRKVVMPARYNKGLHRPDPAVSNCKAYRWLLPKVVTSRCG